MLLLPKKVFWHVKKFHTKIQCGHLDILCASEKFREKPIFFVTCDKKTSRGKPFLAQFFLSFYTRRIKISVFRKTTSWARGMSRCTREVFYPDFLKFWNSVKMHFEKPGAYAPGSQNITPTTYSLLTRYRPPFLCTLRACTLHGSLSRRLTKQEKRYSRSTSVSVPRLQRYDRSERASCRERVYVLV